MTKSASDTFGGTFRRYAALAALMIAAAAGAQEYPNRPIRIVVPFPPGGLVDTVARLISSKLADALGQRGLPVVVDNRSGAGGSLGTEMVAKSAPDGYTLLMVVDTHAVNPHIYRSLRYNIFTDLAPISLVVKIPLVIVAHPSLPADSIKELVALAKSKPGALSYASAGAGTAGHLAAEQFKLLAGIDIVHVPYKGGAPAITDLLGGQVQLSFIATSVTVPYVRANKLKALALSGTQRSAALPNVPTMAESGFPQLDTGSWVGFLAPARTPAAIVTRLSTEVANILKDPDIRGKLTEQAMDIVGSTPAQFGAFVRSEHDKWGKLIKDANLNIAQ
jgi:tripartite-type tricarboxylate transporter receptor subunit TctC